MKEAYYFSHDSNARHDPKITAMRGVYGSEGYGWYWMLVEMMRESEGYKLDLQSKYAFNAFALQLQGDSKRIEEFVHDCINEFDLFVSDEKHFWSASLLRRMDIREQKSEARRKAARARWDKEKQAPEDDNNNAKSMQMHSNADANGMQGKESKVKERESKGNEIDTTSDFTKIEKAYAEIHQSMGLKPADWPLVQKMLDEGINAEMIIETMKEKHAKKTQDGGKVNGFSFYTNAIIEKVSQQARTQGRLDFLNDL